MALAWWLVPCLPFLGLPHIYFLFTARLTIFHVCRNENFRNRYLSFYWKKWFYIWYMALAWWLVPCLPFPDLPHIYFLFTARLRIFHVFTVFSGNECWDIYKFDTNERVGVFLARRSVQHLVTHRCRITYTGIIIYKGCHDPMVVGCTTMFKIVLYITDCAKSCHNFHSSIAITVPNTQCMLYVRCFCWNIWPTV
jgi:hypothetical protein